MSKAVPVPGTGFNHEHGGTKLVRVNSSERYRLVVVNSGGEGQDSSQTGQSTLLGYRLGAYTAGSTGVSQYTITHSSSERWSVRACMHKRCPSDFNWMTCAWDFV